jgi:hypothetical protein
MKQGPRLCRLSSEMALVTACGLWIVHQACVHRIHNNIIMAVESLCAERCALLREIMLAKRCTAIERDALTKFCALWRHLLRFTVDINDLMHVSY